MPEQPKPASHLSEELKHRAAEERRDRVPEHILRRYQEDLGAHQQRLAETQRVLEQMQQLHRTLYDAAPVSLMMLDAEGRIEDINSTGARLLGTSKRSLTGRAFVEFVVEADRPRFLQHLRESRDTGQPAASLLHLDAADEVVLVQLSTELQETAATSGRWTKGQWLCQTAITRLVERRPDAEALQVSEAQLKLAEAAGGVGSWNLDLVTRELRWSDEHFLLLGLQPGSVRPSYRIWRQRLHPADRKCLTVSALWRADLNSVALDYRVLLSEGRVRWLSSRGRVLRDGQGNPIRITGVSIDITEAKETHRKLEELNEALTQQTREAEGRSEQLRVLASQLTEAENRERRRLALLLHDHLQQLLIAARMKISATKQKSPPGQAADWITQAGELLDEAVAATRSLSVELSPPLLYESGLAAALEWLARQMEEKHGLHVDIEATDEPEDDDIRVFLFQCVRELLFNTVKHAEVSEARVSMHRLDEERIVINVADQGKGCAPQRLREQWSSADSFGLRSIHERLRLLGGRCDIDTAPGQGTRASLVAPIRKPRALNFEF